MTLIYVPGIGIIVGGRGAGKKWNCSWWKKSWTCLCPLKKCLEWRNKVIWITWSNLNFPHWTTYARAENELRVRGNWVQSKICVKNSKVLKIAYILYCLFLDLCYIIFFDLLQSNFRWKVLSEFIVLFLNLFITMLYDACESWGT